MVRFGTKAKSPQGVSEVWQGRDLREGVFRICGNAWAYRRIFASVAGNGLRQIVWVGGQGPKDIEGVRRTAGWANIVGKVLTSRGIPVEISFEIENE